MGASDNSDSVLRGKRLKTAMLVLMVVPSFLLFGYCNGSTGGILGLKTFNDVSHNLSVLIFNRLLIIPL